jgi:hypothetical protein
MRPTFFRDLHLISLFKYEKKMRIFFSPGTMDTSDHGTKNEPKGTFELIQIKKIFLKKSIKIALPTMILTSKMIFMKIGLVFR